MTLPLSGVKVLDLTRALSGPFCSMILGDLGADVIKVEPSPNGDMVRQWGPFDKDISVYYLSANRNKRGIGINFRIPEGLALIKDMALKADIVVENFKVGTADSMGLGYSDLNKARPDLIYTSISGYGSKGPASSWPGFDQIAQGYSGFMSLTGNAESGPMRVGTAIGDLTSGMWAAMGTLAAYVQKQNSGVGQHVQTSLLASLVGLLSVQGQRYLSVGEVPEPCGNVHPVIAPYGTFETADGPLNLAPATQDMWLRLCELIEMPQLADDPRFLTNADRMQNRMDLKVLIDSGLSKRTRMEWTQLMIKAGIPAGPINNLEDVFNDEQVLAAGLVESVEHPVIGKLKQVGFPVEFSGFTDGSVRMPPPVLGQHTTEILKELGFESKAIAEMFKNNIVI